MNVRQGAYRHGGTANILTHITAAIVVTIWGTTFVSTKVLLNTGLTAFEIFFYRFLLSYVAIWIISPRKIWSDNFRDELAMLVLGLTGGSVYFLTENIAVDLSTASNVSLIVCSNPLLTMLIVVLMGGERLGRLQAVGSVVAFAGMALVVLNGQFYLDLSPAGDLLALCAAVTWSVYTLVIRRLTSIYPVTFITRKVFFYGLVTLVPVWLAGYGRFDLSLLTGPVVWGNLLYLGLVASLVCYVAWNRVIGRLGSIRSSNYIYAVPLATMVTAALILHERVTWLAALGTFMILGGLYLSAVRRTPDKQR